MKKYISLGKIGNRCKIGLTNLKDLCQAEALDCQEWGGEWYLSEDELNESSETGLVKPVDVHAARRRNEFRAAISRTRARTRGLRRSLVLFALAISIVTASSLLAWFIPQLPSHYASLRSWQPSVLRGYSESGVALIGAVEAVDDLLGELKNTAFFLKNRTRDNWSNFLGIDSGPDL